MSVPGWHGFNRSYNLLLELLFYISQERLRYQSSKSHVYLSLREAQ